MFSYYGSKSKIVQYYPKPVYSKIIEPFAGSARYSLKYWENEIVIVDKYERLINIWKYLQQATNKDIQQLPILKKGENLNDYKLISNEEKDLLGFMIQAGVNAPRLTCTEAGVRNQKTAKNNILRDLHKIKHWAIIHGNYEDLENEEATWFIDPPYQFGGEYYRVNNKHIDYYRLGEWCENRYGQTIVCENTKADWLPFKPLKKIQGMAQTNTIEAIYTNTCLCGKIETKQYSPCCSSICWDKNLNGFEKNEVRGQKIFNYGLFADTVD